MLAYELAAKIERLMYADLKKIREASPRQTQHSPVVSHQNMEMLRYVRTIKTACTLVEDAVMDDKLPGDFF